MASEARAVATAELVRALQAIAEGYEIAVSDDRYIIVENPDFQPDNGSNPKLLIDVYAVSNALSGVSIDG